MAREWAYPAWFFFFGALLLDIDVMVLDEPSIFRCLLSLDMCKFYLAYRVRKIRAKSIGLAWSKKNPSNQLGRQLNLVIVLRY